MTVPLAILAGLSLAGGFLNTPHFMHLGNSQWMAHWFSWVIPMQEVHLGESTEWMLMIVTTSMAVAVLIISYFIYTKKSSVPVPDAEQKGLTRVIAHKFYVDEIYDFLFVRPLERLSRLFHYYVDMQGIDGIVNGVGSGVQKLGAGFRKLQNGNIEYYLIGMVAGVILLLLTLFI
jgi:NADH-quinone oxidoreductase subunit L